jgi:4-hydroxybenzoate polyprenyltransferase
LLFYFIGGNKFKFGRYISIIQTDYILASICIRYSLKGGIDVGLAFNWGALLGWPALLGGDLMAWNVILPLYISGIFWTLAYDTIYAHQVSILFTLLIQDKLDDVQVGIKSTALRFGNNTKPILTAFTLAQVSLLGVTGIAMGAGIPFYSGVLMAGGIQAWMIYDVDIDDNKSCATWFVRNVWTGGVIWLGCLAEWGFRMGGMGLGDWFSVTG